MISPNAVYIIVAVAVVVTAVFIWLLRLVDKDVQQARIGEELGVVTQRDIDDWHKTMAKGMLDIRDKIREKDGLKHRDDKPRDAHGSDKQPCPGCARRFERFGKALRGTDHDRPDVSDPGSTRRGIQGPTKK